MLFTVDVSQYGVSPTLCIVLQSNTLKVNAHMLHNICIKEKVNRMSVDLLLSSGEMRGSLSDADIHSLSLVHCFNLIGSGPGSYSVSHGNHLLTQSRYPL